MSFREAGDRIVASRRLVIVSFEGADVKDVNLGLCREKSGQPVHLSLEEAALTQFGEIRPGPPAGHELSGARLRVDQQHRANKSVLLPQQRNDLRSKYFRGFRYGIPTYHGNELSRMHELPPHSLHQEILAFTARNAAIVSAVRRRTISAAASTSLIIPTPCPA